MFKNFDGYEILLILVGFGLFIMCILAGVGFSRNFDKSEESCVIFYKENHYVTENCKKYTSKLKEIK